MKIIMRKTFAITLCLTVFLSVFFSLSRDTLGGGTTTGEAKLTWVMPTTNVDGTPYNDPGGIKLYYGTASGIYTTILDVALVTTYTVTNLAVGTTYYFVATAYDTMGNESNYSNEVFKTITAGTTTLAAPTGLQVSANGGTVTISWDKPDYANIGGFQIQRGPTATLFTGIYDVGVAYPDPAQCVVNYTGCARKQFIFNGVTPGTYFWRIAAYDGSSQFSAYSDAIWITISSDTAPAADVTLFTAAQYSTGVRLTWTNPTNPDFAGVKISYSTIGNNGPWALLTSLTGATPGSKEAYNHLNLPAGKTYYYKIQVLDTSGNQTNTRYASLEELNPQNNYPTAIANFTATPGDYIKEVTMNGKWPINPHIKSAKLEYRIIGYDKKILGEFAYTSAFDGIIHNYSDRLIGEKVEYTLTLADAEGKQITQVTAAVQIPKNLKTQCDCGGGGREFEIIADHADTDFPKTVSVAAPSTNPTIENPPAGNPTPPMQGAHQPDKTKKKKEVSGFGCGTTKNNRPTGGSTDAGALALAIPLLFLAYRHRLRARIN